MLSSCLLLGESNCRSVQVAVHQIALLPFPLVRNSGDSEWFSHKLGCFIWAVGACAGGAGVGKSFTVDALVQLLRGSRRAVAVTASTGTAALNINGMTVHRSVRVLRCVLLRCVLLRCVLLQRGLLVQCGPAASALLVPSRVRADTPGSNPAWPLRRRGSNIVAPFI